MKLILKARDVREKMKHRVRESQYPFLQIERKALSVERDSKPVAAVSRIYAHLFVIAALSLMVAGKVFALASDSQQPIEIQADFAELDDQEGKTVYIGNVVVVQGSINMKGDKLKVNFSEERDLEEVFLEGRPAYFKQTPDNGDDVEGEALLIEYHANKSLLHLIQKAKLTQGERLFEGDRINYDTEKSVITARGLPKPKTENGKPKKGGRVRVIIPPRKAKTTTP